MKTKELKKLANEIVALERIIDADEDHKAVNKAKNRILEISGSLDVDDMLRIDELVQEQMQNQS
jgi:replicative DNA helicase